MTDSPIPSMTSRERMLTAMRNRQPDMVPVAPDISNMVPCRLTGKPFWDLYLHNDPPLWKAYIEAVRFFQMDGWFTCGGLELKRRNQQFEVTGEPVSQSDERIVMRHTWQTPAGELWNETTFYIDNPPTMSRKWIKDFKQDMPKLRYFFPEIVGYDDRVLQEMRRELGEAGALGYHLAPPGMQDLIHWFDDSLMGASVAYYEQRDLLDELVAMQTACSLREAEMALDARPDFILLSCSGLWTLNTPEAFHRYNLPLIQTVSKWGRQADVIVMLHSCGRERELVEICANETELFCINPLEIPPMGDCDLAEIKQKYGHKLALMGNLHTTEVMLRGTPDTVRRAAMEAIDDAKAGGGFILSTGDQCGRDTPLENIHAMVRTAREYGRY